ncbi:DUF6282 family protein [Caballeronia telluris]|uniref:Amidohydrolase n=1 Tax=Caballeronia telluris TaxID=326475 RepID=A0A158K4H1_9BURK|nr:DUF6282 family protein [Caballeronia telluris]SAL76094.1 hypothetical protein AWB66_05328 [Caballeronia telluris]
MTSNYYPYPPGGPTVTDRILKGAIDLHHHGYPEISFEAKTRLDDVDEMSIARNAGMLGIVLKSHMFPTVGRAYHLRNLVPGIEIFPSITLNYAVGGLNPLAIESAAKQGAKVVFMPTWSAEHDIQRGGMSRHLRHFIDRAESTLRPGKGIRLTGSNGKLLQETRECLDCARQYGMTICTGHVSPRESLALALEAKDYGINEVIFSHPDSNSVGANREEIRDMCALGAVCEFCALGCLPPLMRMKPKDFADIVGDIGEDKVILTTDYFFEWSPPGPETMRMLIGTFLALGMSETAVRKMVRENPARMLGMDADRLTSLDAQQDAHRAQATQPSN